MHPELRQDVLHMALHGEGADPQAPGDVRGRHAVGEERQHLALAGRERGRPPSGDGRSTCLDSVNEGRQIAVGQDELAGDGPEDRPAQHVGRSGRLDDAARSRRQRKGRVRAVHVGQGEDPDMGSSFPDAADRLHAVGVPVQIHDGDVDPRRGRADDRRVAIRDRGDDPDTRASPGERPELVRQDRVGADHENVYVVISHP